jgi:hypothetical protein
MVSLAALGLAGEHHRGKPMVSLRDLLSFWALGDRSAAAGCASEGLVNRIAPWSVRSRTPYDKPDEIRRVRANAPPRAAQRYGDQRTETQRLRSQRGCFATVFASQ